MRACTLRRARTRKSALAAECQVDRPLETGRACCFDRGPCDRQGATSKLDDLSFEVCCGRCGSLHSCFAPVCLHIACAAWRASSRSRAVVAARGAVELGDMTLLAYMPGMFLPSLSAGAAVQHWRRRPIKSLPRLWIIPWHLYTVVALTTV